MLVNFIGRFESFSSLARLQQQKESNPKVHDDNDNIKGDSFACPIHQ